MLNWKEAGCASRWSTSYVVINLELKQVDTKTFLAMKGYVTFVQVRKSKMKIISY